MPTNTNLGVGAMKRHEEYYFRDGNIRFVVDTTEFRLHRYFFERESDYFRDLLAPSSGNEDHSINDQYRIPDVKSEEFADFVWVWYNPRYSFSRKDKQKWLTILRLATTWRFNEIRKLAIRHLEKVTFEPVEKIKTYREYSVDEGLLLPSYVSLCKSPTLPSPEEGRILKMETVLKLASAREQAIISASERGYKTPTTASVPDDVVNMIVADLFGLTLQSDDQTVQLEGQTGNTSRDGRANPEVVTVKEPSPSNRGNVNGDTSQASSRNTALPNGTTASAIKGKQKGSG